MRFSTGAMDDRAGLRNQLRPDVNYERPAGGGRRLFDLVGDLHGKTILDLGCGLGGFRPQIEQRGGTWVGMDLAGERVSVVGDAYHLPFGAGSFDGVLCAALFEHIPDLDVTMREIQRVLRTGGKLFGYASFLEPFHGMSYFHMSHMGLEHLFLKHGFRPTHVFAPQIGTAYQLECMLFPKPVPVIQPIARVALQRLFAAVLAVNRGARAVMYAVRPGSGGSDSARNLYRQLLSVRFAVGFNFVAVKDETAMPVTAGYTALVRED
ncbi:MAG TPA: class I SAM-dependent methyltransferase [Candidatus Krumholzibacteria bacterium]|nr:class I SAM-dependent methyltransferase [Candidatus Krumholzibacteria bacterium]